MAEIRRHPNRLGIKGWAAGGRWGFERYLYILHRISGVGLLAYFLLHVVVTSSRALGPESWRNAMGAVSGGIFVYGELLVVAAFAFHAANGVRLILVELGILTGKAEEPVYPYQSSLNVQRPFMIVMMIVAAAAILFGGYELLLLRH